MTAVVVVPFGFSAAWAIGTIAITLAAWVLIAQWSSPKGKRLVAVAVLAAVLAVTVHANEEDEGFVMEDPCKKYTSSSWQYWAFGCFLP